MFKKRLKNKERSGDFLVTSLNWGAETVDLRIGPRFKTLFLAGVNCESVSTDGSTLMDLYSPESSFVAVLVHAYLLANGDENEISRYFPMSLNDDGTLAPEATGGVFTVPTGQKTYFWMKICSSSARPRLDYSQMDSEWSRIEYGNSVPTGTTQKFLDGIMSYTVYLPFLSVNPNGFDLNLEYYDCGTVQYFSPTYVVNPGGNSQEEQPFDFSELSPISG